MSRRNHRWGPWQENDVRLCVRCSLVDRRNDTPSGGRYFWTAVHDDLYVYTWTHVPPCPRELVYATASPRIEVFISLLRDDTEPARALDLADMLL